MIIVPSNNYYERSEVSNSDLTTLKNLLHPGLAFRVDEAARQAAFRFGSLVDALITESDKVNHYSRTIADDPVPYSEAEWQHAMEMRSALLDEASRDQFLLKVLSTAHTQTAMVNPEQPLEYGMFPFSLPVRCKWDWWLQECNFGGDLKTTFASTQKEFEEAIDFFDWDRSRAYYMDIARSERDFIYAISKKNCRVFKHFIRRGDATYQRGRAKYEELAFQYWCLNLNVG